MNEIKALLNAIFGLNSPAPDGQPLGFGTPDAQPGFTTALPAWAFALVLLAIAGLVWWSYRAVPGRRAVRVLLAVSRTLILTLMFVLALGPRIEQSMIETEPDWVLVLVDRSASLQTPDAGGSDDARDQQLRAMLRAGEQSWGELAQNKRVIWMGFGERTRVLAEGAVPRNETLGDPDELGSDIDLAIRDALRQSAARPVSAIVLITDGRATRAIDPELLATLAERQVPVVSVPLGGTDPVRDMGIARVEHPDAVFAEDMVPVRVHLETRGIDADDLRLRPVRVELVDHEQGRVLDTVTLGPEHLSGTTPPDTDQGTNAATPEPVTLMHTPEGDGERRLDVRIVSERPGDDLNPDNNLAELGLRIVDRPLRVLYIDGYPRWEHRYLKFMLLREPSIVSSSLLLSASRRYIQEGDELIAAVPSTLAEWEPFDVVILGDVRAELFSQQQLETLIEHIETRGAGLLWVAGPSSVPDGYLNTALSGLLPMRKDAGGSQPTTSVWDSEVTMRAAPEATRLGVLRLDDTGTGWLDRLSDPATGWSKLRWALQLDETSFKPGVSVLARAHAVDSAQQAPLITMMRYGAGVSMLVGTDEIWRWRYGRGEDLHERFWLPIIRTLGRGTVARRAAPGQLVVSPGAPTPEEPTQVTLRVFDQQRIDALPERVRVRVASLADRGEPIEIELAGTGDTRTGAWVPGRTGSFELRPLGLDAQLSAVSERARVLDRTDERRVLDSNHDALASIAEATGGWITPAESFDLIPEQLPNRARTIASPPRRESLWDKPVVLILLISLLSIEWIGRRLLRLA